VIGCDALRWRVAANARLLENGWFFELAKMAKVPGNGEGAKGANENQAPLAQNGQNPACCARRFRGRRR
jgi:hypothetical protein